jgi:hypothetical protein
LEQVLLIIEKPRLLLHDLAHWPFNIVYPG